MKLKEKIEALKSTAFSMFPDAKTELDYDNEFQLLIAILMSAQTTDMQVNKVNKIFFSVLKTPDDGIKLGRNNIEGYIGYISFFRNKSKHIEQTSILLKEKYNYKIPRTIDELTSLPGVGIKTAKVFLAVIDNAPFLGVDTHVHRVLNRTGIVNTKTALETDKKAEKIFDETDLASLHNTLIFFGRYHCTARNPKCTNCKLSYFCKYYKTTVVKV